MNKTRFDFTGGHPLTLDDFEFMQEALRGGFTDTFKRFGNRLRLWGCAVSIVNTGGFSALYTVTEGAVYRDGEILYVPAFSQAVVFPTLLKLLVQVQTSAPADNPVQFNDGDLHSVNEIRTGRITSATGGTGETTPTGNIDDIRDYVPLNEAIFSSLPVHEAWRYVGTSGQPAFNGTWGNTGSTLSQVGFRKDGLGRVWLKGCYKSNVDASPLVFTLPAGYRPSKNKWMQIFNFNGSHMMLNIRPDGKVQMGDGLPDFLPGGTIVGYSLDGLSFDLD